MTRLSHHGNGTGDGDGCGGRDNKQQQWQLPWNRAPMSSPPCCHSSWIVIGGNDNTFNYKS